MNSSTLRRFWSLIEEISSETLLKLEDKDLVKELLNQLDHKYPLNSRENLVVENYINSKTLLISTGSGELFSLNIAPVLPSYSVTVLEIYIS